MLAMLREHLSAEQRRFVKFCVVGASGVVVNLGFVWVGLGLAEDLPDRDRDAIASLLGILVSVFGNFLLNNMWTWGDRPKATRKRELLTRVMRYYLASAAAIAIQFGAAQGLVVGMGLNLYLAQCVGIGLGTFVNYIANNAWTFRKGATDEGPAESASKEP